jgi:hypothetical protein
MAKALASNQTFQLRVPLGRLPAAASGTVAGAAAVCSPRPAGSCPNTPD